MKKNKIILQIVVISLVIGFSFYKTNKEILLFNKLKKQNNRTVGVITYQYSVGYASSFYIQYEYVVNNKTYTNEINSSKFIGCEKSKECIGRRFIVYYDENNPNVAVIDFDNELKNK